MRLGTRLALLAWIGGMPMAAATEAEGPEFRLLNHAQYLYGDGAWEEIRLVQDTELLQGTEQAIPEIDQPPEFGIADVASQAATTTAADLASLASLRRELGGPRLSTFQDTTLNTEVQVEAVENITGRVDTGAAETAPVDIVPASSFNLASVPDAAETIVASSTTQTFKARRRSPIGFDPRIRGYYFGQIYTTLDGSYQTPVREDLDGLLSKIDPWLIGNVQVISGPYGLRYGSGFAFVNVDTIPTPRYDCPENHLRLGTHVRTNGGQTYNTATLYGGGQNSGYYVNTGYRKGSDYEAGNGLSIPSSYEALNVLGAYGIDLDDETRMITRFNHVNEGETEYAGQFFDVDDLKYYGIIHSIIHRDECCGFGYRIDTWFNDSEFNGDTSGGGKRRANFPVLQRVDEALDENSPGGVVPDPEFFGVVDGALVTAGFRAGMTREWDDDTSAGAGVDFRYIRQRITETFDISEFGVAPPTLFSTGLPTGEIFDPGLYVEYTTGLTPYWDLATGARVAFASTQADPDQVNEVSNFRDTFGNIDRDLDVSDTLTSFYVTNDLELSPNWRSRIGMGYAERIPTLLERYSDGVFLAIIQSGFSRVIGRPELDKERNWQVDARIDADYEYVRGRLSGFHAWIIDYITYQANTIQDPTGARLLEAINTDYATLTGFEAYGEADLCPGLQSFAALSYIDGRDREIDAPLPGIYPLEGRIGLRWTDVAPENRWGVEWGWRIVDNQDRLGTLRARGAGLPPIAVETETPGFAVSYLRSYMRPSDRVSLTAGIENLFDRNYREHLDLRLPPSGSFGSTFVLAPGITPYFGVEVDY